MEDYKAPKDIIEAKIRMLQGERFYDSTPSSRTRYYPDCYGDFLVEIYNCVTGEAVTKRMPNELFKNCKDWLPYKEPEPEFPFQFDELVCVRDDSSLTWRSGRYSHVIDKYFSIIGGYTWNELTTFSHDLLGKVCEPDTPVWIVREGKPCVKK